MKRAIRDALDRAERHPKGVTFGPCQISHDGAYSWIHVYHDGDYVGDIDRLEGDGGWSANKKLDKRYAKSSCEKLPLKEAKRTVKRAIRDALDRAERSVAYHSG